MPSINKTLSKKIRDYLLSDLYRTAEMIETLDNAIFGTFPDLDVDGLMRRSYNGSRLTSSVCENEMLLVL